MLWVRIGTLLTTMVCNIQLHERLTLIDSLSVAFLLALGARGQPRRQQLRGGRAAQVG